MSNVGDRSSFFDITTNEDVKEFLQNCKYLKEPSENEIEDVIGQFIECSASGDYPNNIIGLDSNFYEANIRKDIPFTNVGFVKVSNVLMKKKEVEDLSDSKFLDPFKVAKINKNNESYVFVFPSSNILYKGQSNVRDGFRFKLEESFKNMKSEADEDSSLFQTLFWLFENKKSNIGSKEIYLDSCPNCKEKNIKILNINVEQFCPYCHNQVYATDCLRIWEEVKEDSISNQSALSRFSNVIKTVFLAHYLRMIKLKNSTNYLKVLNDTMFVLNGPLAVFGNPAWVHGGIMKIIYDINTELKSNGYKQLMIIGMPQYSEILSYANLIGKHIQKNSILCISDAFRAKYISFTKQVSSSTFGSETYYGQDFIYKTSKNKIKAFSIPYTFKNKENIKEFKIQKSELANYSNITNYLQFIEDFDCDLFDNSVIPSVLAKKYSIINLQPGAKVLDLITSSKLQ